MTGLEKLLQRKLPAETFQAVKAALDPEDLDYVPRSRLDDVIDERDTARADLRKLQKSSGDAAGLQQKLDDLQAKYDADIAAKDTEIKGIHRNHKIEAGIQARNAKNAVAVRALLNEDALGEELEGLDAELDRVVKSDPYLFGDAPGAPTGTGKDTVGAGEGDDLGGTGGSADDEVTEEMYNAVFGGGIY